MDDVSFDVSLGETSYEDSAEIPDIESDAPSYNPDVIEFFFGTPSPSFVDHYDGFNGPNTPEQSGSNESYDFVVPASEPPSVGSPAHSNGWEVVGEE